MDDDDPFSSITRSSYCSPFLEELLNRLPYVREQEVYDPFRPRAITVPSYPPPPTAAVNVNVNVAHAESIRVGENRSPNISTPIEEPSPNKQVRASTREVGECSKKRKLEIPKDIEIIAIEDSDDEGEEGEEEEVREVEIAEDAGAQRRRLLPLWGRMNQKAQDHLNARKSKQREDDKITILALLEVLAREEKEARLKLGLDDGTTGDFLETAIRRGVKFGKSR